MRRGATTSAMLILFLCFTHSSFASGADEHPRVDEAQRPIQEPKVKEGSKDDINAIGNRDLGGRGLGNWYSLETEIKMGREYAQMIDSSVKLVADPVVTEYVNRLGQNIVRNSDSKVPFIFKVIDANEINAFALPGGFLYVHGLAHFHVGAGIVADSNPEAEYEETLAKAAGFVAALNRGSHRQVIPAPGA